MNERSFERMKPVQYYQAVRRARETSTDGFYMKYASLIVKTNGG